MGGRRYYREERYFLSNMHKYFYILWPSIIGGQALPLVFNTDLFLYDLFSSEFQMFCLTLKMESLMLVLFAVSINF